MPEMVRNAVKFNFIRKMCKKSRRRQTGSSGDFGLLLVKLEFVVAESEKRVAAIFLLPVWPLEPPGRSFLLYSGLYCRGIVHRRLEKLSIRNRVHQICGPEVQFRNRKYFQ